MYDFWEYNSKHLINNIIEYNQDLGENKLLN